MNIISKLFGDIGLKHNCAATSIGPELLKKCNYYHWLNWNHKPITYQKFCVVAYMLSQKILDLQ